MKTYSYKIVIEEDELEDGERAYHISCPTLKGCHTWGATQQEALKNIQEAVAAYLESLIKHNEPIPADGISEEPVVSITVPA
jgi:predicted RNase H-like HicB family nuclease